MSCSCLLLLGSLIWYFSRQLNPWNILEKVSLQNSRQQAVFFQPWFLYITSSYLHLCCAMSSAHLCRQRSEGRGRRHGCEVFPEGWHKTSLASISRFLSVPVTCQTSLLCPQTGTQLPGVVCLPSYASSHRAYFSSSWMQIKASSMWDSSMWDSSAMMFLLISGSANISGFCWTQHGDELQGPVPYTTMY